MSLYKKKTKTKRKKQQRGRCKNPVGCYRPANGTDGHGWCMHCEDDASNNQPMEDAYRYYSEWTPFGLVWYNKQTHQPYDPADHQ